MTRYVITERSDEFDFWDPVVDLPAMQPGDSVRVTLKASGSFDVVLVRPSAAAREAWGAQMWAEEQEGGR